LKPPVDGAARSAHFFARHGDAPRRDKRFILNCGETHISSPKRYKVLTQQLGSPVNNWPIESPACSADVHDNRLRRTVSTDDHSKCSNSKADQPCAHANVHHEIRGTNADHLDDFDLETLVSDAIVITSIEQETLPIV
jgi:hypothetical protein